MKPSKAFKKRIKKSGLKEGDKIILESGEIGTIIEFKMKYGDDWAMVRLDSKKVTMVPITLLKNVDIND